MAEAKDKDLARKDAAGDEVLGDPRPKEKEPLAGGKAAGTILVTFVDSEKLTVLSPEDGRIAMEIQKADGTVVEKNAILQKVDPKGKDAQYRHGRRQADHDGAVRVGFVYRQCVVGNHPEIPGPAFAHILAPFDKVAEGIHKAMAGRHHRSQCFRILAIDGSYKCAGHRFRQIDS